MRQVRESAHAEAADVIHVHNTWFALSQSVLSAGESLGVPTVATVQNYRLACAQGQFLRDGGVCELCLGGSALHGIRHRCYRGSAVLTAWNSIATRGPLRNGVWNRLSAIIVPARFAADQLIRAGLPEDRVVVRPNSAPDPGPRSVAVEDSDVVLFIGRLSPEKGVQRLLEAWRRRPPDLRLVIVGDGPEKASLEREAPAGVTFTGQQTPEQVRDLMLTARVLAFPSVWYEVCPLVIIEAFASGLPVFGHPIGAITELLHPLGGDAIVPDPEPTSWIEAFGRMADDSLIRRLGATAREVYEARYHPLIGLKSIEAIYDEAIRR